MTTATKTAWNLVGTGYEFCNCDPGCTCNFSGFPSSADGSCKAAVGCRIREGSCGDVDLSGIDVAALYDWPKAIHDGGGKAVFCVPPSVTDAQLGCLAEIFTGQLGGMPWEILGTTYEVAGVVRAEVNFTGEGMNQGFSIPGVGQAQGGKLKNPVTGEEHDASIGLADGFIWTHGDCGVGTFDVEAEGVHLDFKDTNWILYEFAWSNG